ncbi:MAG TPA: DUF1905 domain-containing protein [Chryseolinea sp.]
MIFTFRAKIYKVGINACVEVPCKITDRMKPGRGYIPVKGTIGRYAFEQTLVPVRHGPYRLYVNGLMLKGSDSKVGDTAKFTIAQTTAKRKDETMPAALRSKLVYTGLLASFEDLVPSRQKEIVRYLNYLKTAEAKNRNIDKVIGFLKDNG